MRQKKAALRLFRHAVKKAFAAMANRLGSNADRSEDDLRGYARKLSSLAKEDPDRVFWTVLQKANLKLLHYLTQQI